jgi:hypothetical protein
MQFHLFSLMYKTRWNILSDKKNTTKPKPCCVIIKEMHQQ